MTVNKNLEKKNIILGERFNWLPKFFINYCCILFVILLTGSTVRLMDIMFFSGGSAVIAGQQFGFSKSVSVKSHGSWSTILR